MHSVTVTGKSEKAPAESCEKISEMKQRQEISWTIHFFFFFHLVEAENFSSFQVLT